jgi:hypothetical protein
MAIITGKICICDVCGHRWLAEGDKEPARCPSRRCWTRKWNGGSGSGLEGLDVPEGRAEEGVEYGAVKAHLDSLTQAKEVDAAGVEAGSSVPLAHDGEYWLDYSIRLDRWAREQGKGWKGAQDAARKAVVEYRGKEGRR